MLKKVLFTILLFSIFIMSLFSQAHVWGFQYIGNMNEHEFL